MNILKKIQEYFLTYDKLDADGRIYANNTPLEAVNYSIIELPSGNGGVLRTFGQDQVVQFQFSFEAKVLHSSGNDTNNFDNSQFFTDLKAWVEDNNLKGILPDIPNCQSIEVIQTPYLKGIEPTGQYAIHSMSVRVIYYKERLIYGI